ncbi:hypothetical protein H5410_032811 [Solanum commersonii]|uniref:Uncharacterized protein n=1 Tax=Solanum commersonii TaxID=4109 RepID=A0A9J5YM26_SOLCO|nr:hypothetical protein H5410_032811 [Solanum commersonii]
MINISFFVVFNPEKKNPYVKHLLSLKVYDGIKDCLSYKSHLKHLRLLKSLNLNGITLTDEIETLVVDNLKGSCMILSPCFWSLAKLRDMRMKCCALFDLDINEPTVFPNLQNLEVYIKQLPDCSTDKIGCCNGSIALSSDSLSRIARLPNLQELSLEDAIIEEGKEWNMEDVTFQNLKSLTLVRVEFSEWQRNHFPFGDIASLELIKALLIPQFKESIFDIKEYVEEMTGED